jgi:hypothetical protein
MKCENKSCRGNCNHLKIIQKIPEQTALNAWGEGTSENSCSAHWTRTKESINMKTQDICGTRWRSWFRHCAKSLKVAGSIPDGVTGIFQWLNSSRLIVALGSTRKWVPGIFPGGKDGRCVGLTTLPPSCADCLEILEPQTPGTRRARPGL